MRPRPWWISFVVILIVNYLLVQVFLPERPAQRIDVPFTYFKQQVMVDNVSDVTSRGDVIQGTFKQSITYPPDQAKAPSSTLFQTVMPQFADTGLETLLKATTSRSTPTRWTSRAAGGKRYCSASDQPSC
jgi:cell division protease FtsH